MFDSLCNSIFIKKPYHYSSHIFFRILPTEENTNRGVITIVLSVFGVLFVVASISVSIKGIYKKRQRGINTIQSMFQTVKSACR